MEDPTHNIRAVVRSLTEPKSSVEILSNVDKYFTTDAILVHPMLNSPKAAGREGVKAAYKMLKVLTYGNRIDFHAVGFDKVVNRKGREHQSGLLDMTEHLQLTFLPLPQSLNPVLHIRFLVRIDLEKDEATGLWHICKQEDNLPTDFGSTGLVLFPGLKEASDLFKWVCGSGTLLVGSTLTRFNLFA